MGSKLNWLLILVALGMSGCESSEEPKVFTVADTVYVNGSVYTMDESQPWARALAIKDGQIVAVGDEQSVAALTDESTERVDLGGRFVMPGIIDGHAHPAWGGLLEVYTCVFQATALPAEVLETISGCVEGAEQSEEWIQGGFWGAEFFNQFQIDSPRLWLDEVSGDKAIALKDDSGHNYWVNSRGLELLGIDEDTEAPPGAIYGRDSDGKLNGILYEAFLSVADKLPTWTAEHYKAGIHYAVANAHSYGVTGWKDASSTETETLAYFELDQASELKVNVATCLIKLHEDASLISVSDYVRMREIYASPRVRTSFAKIFLDGIPTTSRTAAMAEPYLPVEEGAPENYGPIHVPADKLTNAMMQLDALGFTVKIHAAGDRSVHEALNAIEAARQANGSDLRHELAHAGFIVPEDVARFAELNAVADLSPHLWFPSPIITSIRKALGRRGEKYWPNRSLIDAGAPLSMGSDWPSVAPDMNPWLGLEALVTRADPAGVYPGTSWPEEAITVEEGLRIMTMGGAKAIRLEDQVGSLEVGKSADFAVLDTNPLEVSPDQISELKVLTTVFAGQVVYQAN